MHGLINSVSHFQDLYYYIYIKNHCLLTNSLHWQWFVISGDWRQLIDKYLNSRWRLLVKMAGQQ